MTLRGIITLVILAVLFALAVVLVVIAIANPQQAVRRTPPPQSSAASRSALVASLRWVKDMSDPLGSSWGIDTLQILSV